MANNSDAAGSFGGGLLSGVTSAVIWTSICLGFGWPDTKLVGWVALILLVVVTAVSTTISNVIRSKKAPANQAA